MAWVTPKIDWASDDVVAATDFNRIEGNTLHLKGLVDYQTEGDFLLTFPTPVFTAEQQITVHWWKYRVTSSIAHIVLALPLCVYESNSTAITATGIPSDLYPGTGGASAGMVVRHGSTSRNGYIAIGDGGVIFYILAFNPLDTPQSVTYASDGFPSSGNKGFPKQVIQYATTT